MWQNFKFYFLKNRHNWSESYLEIRNLRMGKCFMLKHIWRRVITLWDKSHRDQRSLSFLASGTGFMGDNFSTDQEDMSDGEWLNTDEASLACPALTCCAAQFLTGRGLVLVCGPGIGGPWSRLYRLIICTPFWVKFPWYFFQEAFCPFTEYFLFPLIFQYFTSLVTVITFYFMLGLLGMSLS